MQLKEARAQGLLEQARIRTSRRRVHVPSTKRVVGKIQHFSVSPEVNPQRMLYEALTLRLGKGVVEYEKNGLIHGRRYRVDIYIPRSKIVIEMDGFAYHKSKSSFQKDRERQNDFMAHGYRVLRYYTGQILHDLGGVVDQICAMDRMIMDRNSTQEIKELE